jgi:Raf kinase inhibitor-like YbhB/YbcL family protein
MSLIIRSKGILNGVIEDRYGRWSDDAEDGVPQLSFPLEWEGKPPGTASFALTFLDYDNIREEGILWVHWLVANIPPDIGALPEDASRQARLMPRGIVQGANTWMDPLRRDIARFTRYGGPAPEQFPHKYEIRLFALNRALPLKDGFTLAELNRAMRGGVLDETAIFGIYRNTPHNPRAIGNGEQP